jgi:hypothetical protein
MLIVSSGGNNYTFRVIVCFILFVFLSNALMMVEEGTETSVNVCFPGVTTHCGCIFHSPVAGFSLLVFELS